MAKLSYQTESLHYSPITFFFLSHLRACLAGFGQMWRRPAGSIMTTFVLAIALALPGSFFSFAAGIKHMLPPWQQSANMTVYLKNNLDPSAIVNIQNTINHMQGIATTTIITPEQGLEELSEQLPMGSIISQLPSNPLPTVIEAVPSQQMNTLEQLKNADQAIGQLPGVDSVQLSYQWVEQVMHLTQMLSRMAILIGGIFALAIILMISNTIRLTLQKDKQDILVMRFLGASRPTILRPLIYQGLWLGFLAGGLAMLIMVALGLLMIHPMNTMLQTFQIQLPVSIFFAGDWLLLVLVFSLGLSFIGTRLSVQNALTGAETEVD
jgi:cell division transport system permease protein